MDPALLALVSVIGTLVGVLIGGWLTARNQKRERRIRFLREQLTEFYGPLLAMRAEVLAKAELRSKISGAADVAWQELIGRAKEAGGVERIQEVRDARFPIFKEIIDYDNRQFAEEIMPAYRRMVERFVDKMYLADVSTMEYLHESIEFVEIWNRWLAKALPAEVVERLGLSEEKLFPFYAEVASRFGALQAEVSEARSLWRRGKRSGTIKVLPS